MLLFLDGEELRLRALFHLIHVVLELALSFPLGEGGGLGATQVCPESVLNIGLETL